MGRLSRRAFMRKAGLAGALGGAAVVGGKEIVAAQGSSHHGGSTAAAHDAHGGLGAVGRVDNVYGDRNLFCACLPPEMSES